MVPAGGYRAFISYSHKDAAWGDWLHKAIESYRVPARLAGTEGRDGPIPARLIPIFRDREELPTSADLGAQITDALKASDYLVVICSPRAAVSRWVNEEILAFKRMGKENRILALIVDGEPNAGDEPSIGMLQAEGGVNRYGVDHPYPRECFPHALKYKLDADGNLSVQRGEPLASDARPDKDGKEAAKLKLIAGLLGVGYDTLRQREHEAQRKRARRFALVSGGIISVLSVLLILSIAFGAASEHERNQALMSQSRHLARDSIMATESGDAGMGLILATKALPTNLDAPERPLTTEALSALNRAWLGLREKYDFAHQHTMIFSAEFSLDSRRLVTASTDDTVSIWDLESGRKSAVLPTHGGIVLSVAFSPDGAWVATASQNKAVQLWDAAHGMLLRPFTGYPNGASNLSFSPDGRYLAGSSGKSVIFWDTVTGEALNAINTNALIESARFSPDGRHLLTASKDGTVKVWGFPGLQPELAIPVNATEMRSANYDKTGKLIITNTAESVICVWDAATAERKTCIDKPAKVVAAANLSPDGRRIVAATGDQTALIFDAASGKHLETLRGHSDMLNYAAYSPDGRHIVTTGWDGTARIWLAEENERTVALRGHTGSLRAAAFSRDGRRIVTAATDMTARVWDSVNGRLLATLPGHTDSVSTAAFSPDGKSIVTGSWDHTARIWNWATQTQGRILKGHSAIVTGAAYGPSGTVIATSGQDGTVRIWDPISGTQRKLLHTPEEIVSSLTWSKDGKLLAAGAGTTGVVWETATWKVVQSFKGHVNSIQSISFAPNNNAVVTASWDKAIGLWLATEPSPIRALMGHTNPVWHAEFSPDQHHILSASMDQTVRIWDIRSSKELLRITGSAGFHHASYSPDGRRIVLAGGDGVAQVRDLPPRCQALIGKANAWVRALDRRPSPEEKAQYLLDAPDQSFLGFVYAFLRPLAAWLSPSEGDMCT